MKFSIIPAIVLALATTSAGAVVSTAPGHSPAPNAPSAPASASAAPSAAVGSVGVSGSGWVASVAPVDPKVVPCPCVIHITHHYTHHHVVSHHYRHHVIHQHLVTPTLPVVCYQPAPVVQQCYGDCWISDWKKIRTTW
jgi:hypothetical protein